MAGEMHFNCGALITLLLVAATLAGVFGVTTAPTFAQTYGICGFDRDALSFRGTPEEQARCLLRPVGRYAHLGESLTSLPLALAPRVGNPTDISIDAARRFLAAAGLSEAAVGGALAEPLSRARDNAPDAPAARYFVIHDTSAPWFGDAPFPSDIDTSAKINNLAGFTDANAVAHLFVNRLGQVAVGHPLSVAWRATKLETQLLGTAGKGMFIHIELVQPRRRDPAGAPHNDAIAPQPGFTAAQYKRLALLYVIVSVRARTWLIPASHAAIDGGISDAHDDPQNFELAKFDSALRETLARIKDAGSD